MQHERLNIFQFTYWWIRLQIAMLKIIKALDPDKCNIVRWFEHFVHRGHTCLVFEKLDISLFDYWNSTLQPLSLLELSVITQQVSM